MDDNACPPHIPLELWEDADQKLRDYCDKIRREWNNYGPIRQANLARTLNEVVHELELVVGRQAEVAKSKDDIRIP